MPLRTCAALLASVSAGLMVAALLASVSAGLMVAAGAATAEADPITAFQPGNLVVGTVQNVDPGASNSGLDTASPITLMQFGLGAGGSTATQAGTLTLPQTGSGANVAISGEYGSASEGLLQNSVDGHSLTVMGYGVNASTFNSANGVGYGTPRWGRPPASRVPEAPPQGQLAGQQAERLDAAHQQSHRDRHRGDRQIAVELAKRLQERPAIGAQHQDAVGPIQAQAARLPPISRR